MEGVKMKWEAGAGAGAGTVYGDLSVSKGKMEPTRNDMTGACAPPVEDSRC